MIDLVKTVWGLLFRLFPCPTRCGLLKIGLPDRNSPVLVTCNFHLTVKRLKKKLEGNNLWLLVADSKGINVWCAAGAHEFNTESVVSVIKTSGILDRIDHNRITLPPLAAPGVFAFEVKKRTGCRLEWGPVRMEDIPDWLATGRKRTETMKRSTWSVKERLDTALGSLFPFFVAGLILFILFWPGLVPHYIVYGAATFLFYFVLVPKLPGHNGLAKVLFLNSQLLVLLICSLLVPFSGSYPLWRDFLFCMVFFFLWGTETGGLSGIHKSEFDPFLARLGIETIGNTSFAGTTRTDLLNSKKVLTFHNNLCIQCGFCSELCPVAVWERDADKKTVLAHPDRCTACTACLKQCEPKAITADP